DRLAGLRERGDVAVEEIEQQARETVEQARNEMLVMAELERLERQKEAIQERQRVAEERLARARADREAVQAAERRRAAARLQNAVAVAEPVGEDTVRRPWDTGPIFSAARNAAVRTVRTVTRRTADRESLSA